jgi:hypothetical protein
LCPDREMIRGTGRAALEEYCAVSERGHALLSRKARPFALAFQSLDESGEYYSCSSLSSLTNHHHIFIKHLNRIYIHLYPTKRPALPTRPYTMAAPTLSPLSSPIGIFPSCIATSSMTLVLTLTNNKLDMGA